MVGEGLYILILCPHCGEKFKRPIAEGLTTCQRCERVSDTYVPEHRILSAAWVVRNWYFTDPQELQQKCGLSDAELEPVQRYVIEASYSHDDFLKIIRSGLDGTRQSA